MEKSLKNAIRMFANGDRQTWCQAWLGKRHDTDSVSDPGLRHNTDNSEQNLF